MIKIITRAVRRITLKGQVAVRTGRLAAVRGAAGRPQGLRASLRHMEELRNGTATPGFVSLFPPSSYFLSSEILFSGFF